MIREVKSDCLPIAGVSRVGADSGSRGVVGSSRVYRLMGTKLVVDSKGVHLDGERDELTVEMGVYNKGGGGWGGEAYDVRWVWRRFKHGCKGFRNLIMVRVQL